MEELSHLVAGFQMICVLMCHNRVYVSKTEFFLIVCVANYDKKVALNIKNWGIPFAEFSYDYVTNTFTDRVNRRLTLVIF